MSEVIFEDVDLKETLDALIAMNLIDDGTEFVANSPGFSSTAKNVDFIDSVFNSSINFDSSHKDDVIHVQAERIEELLIDLEKANSLIGEFELLTTTLENARTDRDRIIQGFQKLKGNYEKMMKERTFVDSTCKECGRGTCSKEKKSTSTKSAKKALNILDRNSIGLFSSSDASFSDNFNRTSESDSSTNPRLEPKVSKVKKDRDVSLRKSSSKKRTDNLKMRIDQMQEDKETLEDEITHLRKSNQDLLAKIEKLSSEPRFDEGRLAAAMENSAMELRRLQEKHKKELAETEEIWKSNVKKLQMNGEKSLVDVEKLTQKLEISLSSDIQSRENLEILLNSIHTASNELSSLVHAGQYATAKSGSQSSESRQFAFVAVSESLRRSLSNPNIPPALKTLFDLVLQISESHISLLQTEISEEKLVERSVRFTQSAQKIIHSLTEELSEASNVIYQTDTFVVNLISVLERRGVLPANEIPRIFTYTEGVNSKFDYSTILPMRLDLEERNKAFSMILDGVNSLHSDGNLLSIIESSNAYAQSIIDGSMLGSPPTSPNRSLNRSRVSTDRNIAF